MSESVHVALGLLALAGVLVPVGAAASIARRRCLRADRPTEVLADLVLAASALLVLVEGLGTLGVYSRTTLGVAAWLLLGVVVVVQRRRPSPTPATASPLPARSPSTPETVVAALAVGVVVVAYVTQTVMTLRVGIRDGDSLWYHLPFAARFAETGHVWPLHHTYAGSPVATYPANAEVLWSTTVVALARDLLLPVANLVWLGAALIAAWIAGARRGNGPLGLVAGAALVGTPVMVATQGGTARNDLLGVSMLMAAAALLLRDDRPPLRLLAGLAVGLALGTKVSMLAPAALMGAALLWHALRSEGRGEALRRSVTPFAIGALVTGLAFYLRNLAETGSPTPWFEVVLGPLRLPKSEGVLADVGPITIPSAVRARPELFGRLPSAYELAWGRAWPLLLVVALTAVALTWQRRRTLERALATTVPVGIVIYAFTPASAQGSATIPTELLAVIVAMNSRYVMPTLGVGLLVAVGAADTTRWRQLLFGALGLVVLGQVVPNEYLASFEWQTDGAARLLAVALVVAAGAALLVAMGRGPGTARRAAVVLGGVALLLVVWAPGYAERRFADPQPENPSSLAYHWFDDLRDVRVGAAGGFFQGGFYGPNLSNHVQWIGTPLAHGGFGVVDGCAAFRRAVDEGRYGYLVLTPIPFTSVTTPPREEAWLEGTTATLVRRDRGASLWAIDGRLGTAGCP